MILTLLKDWKVWVAIGVAVVVALSYAGIVAWGNARYSEGAKDQRIAWLDDFARVQLKAQELESQLSVVTQQRDIARQERDVARRQSLAHVEEEIQNAPDVEAAIVAYREFRDGLHNARSARHASARADYLSSLPADRGGESR